MQESAGKKGLKRQITLEICRGPLDIQQSTDQCMHVRKLSEMRKKTFVGFHTGLGTVPVPTSQTRNLIHR